MVGRGKGREGKGCVVMGRDGKGMMGWRGLQSDGREAGWDWRGWRVVGGAQEGNGTEG